MARIARLSREAAAGQIAARPVPVLADDAAAVQVRDLTVAFRTPAGLLPAVARVSLDLARGQITGLVGESGSGKSTLALTLLNAVPSPGEIVTGSVSIDGVGDVLALRGPSLRQVRGGRLGYVFQASQNSLNPLKQVGKQLLDLGRSHGERDLRGLLRRASGLLDEMGLIRNVHTTRGLTTLIISHDVGVIGELADRIAVMYAGRVVEEGPTEQVLASPRHPYTRGLLTAMPRITGDVGDARALSGRPPDLASVPAQGCVFRPRCPLAVARCETAEPPDTEIGGWRFACYVAAGATA